MRIWMRYLAVSTASMKFATQIVPEYQDENLREKIFQNYRIVYRITGDFIEIVIISHSAKQFSVE